MIFQGEMRTSGTSIISWVNGNNIYYRQDTTTSGNIKFIESENAQQVNLWYN